MIICPYCDSENITGADSCEHCGQPLSDLHLPTPATHVERCLLRDRLGKLLPHRPVTTVAPKTTISDVIKLMAEESIGCVVVTEGDEIIGILSERDVLIKLSTQIAEMANRPVSEFMTPSPQTLDGEAKVAFALHRMALGHYRHVPITDAQGKPVAIISVRDVLRYLTDKMVEADATDLA